MSNPLPPDLITRIKPLLLPYVRDKDEREALFIETYFLRDPRPLDLISFEGSSDIFATRCIADLIKKIGCLAEEGDRQHALAALLLTVRARCGAEHYAAIDHWLSILNDQCVTPTVEPAKPEPVSTSAQTIDTPIDERAASVFISYSHANEEFATQLITDLGGAGHRCWIDTSKIKGGADWQRAICDGINLSYALVVVCTRKALESDYVWDEIQWARTRHKLIIPVLLEDVTDDDRFFGLHRYQGIRFDKLSQAQAVAALIAALPTPPSGDAPPRPLTQREHELAYLDRLRFEDFRLEKFELAEYTALGGTAQPRRAVQDQWQRLQMQQAFTLLPVPRAELEVDAPPEAFTDAVSKITELRRVVVLGEPGAGKTHTLRALAKPLYTAALTDPAAPIPLLVKLGNWDKPDMPFEVFLRGALGELGAHLDDLFTAQRAILLLDGLNEFPADQRAAKYPQVETFIKAHPDVLAVVTCRQADYPISLHLNQVLIRPLDPLRIYDFAVRALRLKSETEGATFFWKLAGGERLKTVFNKWQAAGAEWELFWSAPDVPRENPNVYGSTSGSDDELWRESVRSARSMLQLASNPYMLRMLLDVYIQFKGELPTNRGQLFDQFVNVLLAREKLAHIDAATNAVTLTGEGRALLVGLQQVAFEMQVRCTKQGNSESSAGTSLSLTDVRAILSERLLYLAVSTSILNSGDEVRFSHQLLQEYSAARYMEGEITSGRLKAADIWKPEQWWERTNWEEAVILLAGLSSDDCTPVLDWLAEANPEVTVQCILRSGATTSEATKIRLRDQWLPRLTDIQREPQPKARAAVGRALGLFTIDDLPADHRKGVSVRVRNGVRLPDIDWVLIPDDGRWAYQQEQLPGLPAFQISRYPITYAQFQAFIAADDGFSQDRWWAAMPEEEEVYGTTYRVRELREQYFQYANHPHESVSWYQAVAFCRWLSAQLGYEVTLPTEQQWEKSARGTDARIYPYGNDFDAAQGNTHETGIGQTSAVGLFPNGASPYGVLDLSGNVWEWCLNKYEDPAQTIVDASGAARCLRGGSWDNREGLARAALRNWNDPFDWLGNWGFRVCLSAPI